MRAGAAAAAGLAILAAAPFLPLAVVGTFIRLDDGMYVVQNPVVQAGLTRDGLRWAFTTFHAGNWHPLTWLSHMLDASLFGLDARGHHLTSILIHAASTALLFVALRRLTGRAVPSALVAALFGVHPLHVESVAWVAERKDLLAGFFFMLLLLSHERAVRRASVRSHFLTAMVLALGLMAKPMLVTAPLVLLLLDFWPLGRLPLPASGTLRGAVRAAGRLLLEKLPLLALSAAAAAVTLAAQREGGAIGSATEFPLGLRAANALVSFSAYLGKTLWPASLAVYYPHPMTLPHAGEIAGSLALLALVSAVAALGVRSRPWLAVGWCWYLGMLVPVVGLVQVGGQAMADRYTYLPLCGAFIMAAWSLSGPVARWCLPRRAAAAAIVLVALLAAATSVQAWRWRDSQALFRHTLAVTRENWLVRNNFGAFLVDRGRLAEAEAQYREALRIYPGYPEARNNLAGLLTDQGRPSEALEHAAEAARIAPRRAESHYNLGNCLLALGRREEAVASYREAIRLRPGYAKAHGNLGNALAALGQLEEAVASYRASLRHDPGVPLVLKNLALVQAALGRRGP